jgi:glutathione S-transferase
MEFQPKRRDIPSHVPYPHNRVPMPPGSVFELGSATNRFFKHLIKKCMDVCVSKAYLWSSVDGRSIKTHDEAAVLLREVGRISLTLRDIATWKRRTDGYVVGQGAPSEGPYTRSIEEQRKNMLESFGKDNNETDFNWAENYGKGFDILSIKPCNVLYFINGSISSIRVRTMVRMLGMECREYRLRIMMKRSQTHTRFFSSLNPRKECPFFITTSGVRMNESLAILTYLDRWGCEKAPVDGFIATSNLPSPHFRGLAYAWMQEAENLNAAYEEAEEAIFKRKPGETNPPEHYAKLLRHVAHELEVWIPRIAKPLGGGPFLLGRAMCIADVAFFSVVNYMWRRGLDLTQYDPCLSAYYETVLSHPCCRAGVPPSWDTRRGKVNVFGRLASMAKGAAPEALEKSDEEGDE